MAYIPDLARYNYHPGAPTALAVGWLDSSEPFTTGSCPPDVRDRLARLSEQPVRLMRGYHYCQFCEAHAGPRRLIRAETRLYEAPEVPRGNGEVWFTDQHGTNFAVPALIAHYIDEHNYMPPNAFIDAVREGIPTPGLE